MGNPVVEYHVETRVQSLSRFEARNATRTRSIEAQRKILPAELIAFFTPSSRLDPTPLHKRATHSLSPSPSPTNTLCAWSSYRAADLAVNHASRNPRVRVLTPKFGKLDRHRGDRYYNNNDDDDDSHNHDYQDSHSHSYRHSRGPSRFSDAPPSNLNSHHSRRSGNHRPFESPPRGAGGFRPPEGAGGGGFGLNTYQAPPLSGQKRGFASSGRGSSPDHFDGGSFAKLFVGSVPRTATEEDIRPLFEEQGHVIEVALIKDKRTGQQQGCCFIKYATSEEADRAIRALHNQHTLPGGVSPIQVRYADGERERLGAVEYKLFVGSLNKQATEKEVEEIFSKYGRVEDVYLMRDNIKQSRGCGFVKYSHRDMAVAAINALNGLYTMRGCDQPLTVRFADPKRPRPGDSRAGPSFGGPGLGPRFQSPVARPPQNFGDPMNERVPANSWHPMSPPNLRPPSNTDSHGFGFQSLSRSGDLTLPLNPGGPFGGFSGPADGSLLGQAVSTSQQGFNQSMPQVPPVGQFQKLIHSPQHLPPSLQSHPQAPASYSQMQPPRTSLQHLGQPQLAHSGGQTPSFSQAPPSQQLIGLGGQLSVSQPQVQQIPSSATPLQTPLDINLQPPASIPQHMLQPLQQPPSQFAQMLSQQTQTLQASFQSSQQAFSQLQQQLQLMQPANQALTSQQTSQASKQQQSQWPVVAPQTVPSTLPTNADVPSSRATAPAVPVTQPVAPVKCNWTEHTSPDGYKYYYNSITGDSRWEKPEELTLLEQPQQKPLVQQPQAQSHPQVPSAQQVRQTPPVQLQAQHQTQLHLHQQLQQPTMSSSYQASGATGHQNVQELGYAQLQGVAGSANDPSRFQQELEVLEQKQNSKGIASGMILSSKTRRQTYSKATAEVAE